ncbi:MAG: hypothetical protein JXQ72_16535 [Anaerolineae bacterium]|nr:hypothetical protein [Anaerolineae bacterium]
MTITSSSKCATHGCTNSAQPGQCYCLVCLSLMADSRVEPAQARAGGYNFVPAGNVPDDLHQDIVQIIHVQQQKINRLKARKREEEESNRRLAQQASLREGHINYLERQLDGLRAQVERSADRDATPRNGGQPPSLLRAVRRLLNR